jgi:hypothetical protein
MSDLGSGLDLSSTSVGRSASGASHIHEHAKGGETTQGNGQPACGFHNLLKNKRPEATPTTTTEADADSRAVTEPAPTGAEVIE